MATANDGGEPCPPQTEAECEVIRQQLKRILASDLFTNSKRYPRLLKYIVEETLGGRASYLKERTLGVHVFGRDPSYDTNLDPIVRISAAHVRHRVAEFYKQGGYENEIRIELLPGSYVPQFRRAGGVNAAQKAPPLEVAQAPKQNQAVIVAPPVASQRHHRLTLSAYAAAVGCLAVAVWFVLTHWIAAGAEAQFWGVIWDRSNTIVICVPGKFPTPESPTQTSGVALPDREIATPLSILDSLHLNSITWPDATALYSLVGFIQAHGQAYRVRREGDLPFSDLRTGPVVMIGGFNNQWLMRLTNSYRFTYQSDQGVKWIRDAQNPSRRDWKVVADAPYSTFDKDYGIIARVWDVTTKHWMVVVSGIASYGTIAAGEFLTNPDNLAMLARHAPRGWERRNLQVAFATKVLNGNSGPPQILAVHVW
jgi:hypothetical protein